MKRYESSKLCTGFLPSRLRLRFQPQLLLCLLGGILAGCSGTTPEQTSLGTSSNELSIKSFRLRLEFTKPTEVTVVVHGPKDFWQEQHDRALSGELLTFGLTESEPMLGDYEISGSELRFQPSFPLVDGEQYLATFRLGGETIVLRHQPPAVSKPTPKLLGVYPSGKVVPANHLKFYLVFSEPMADGDAFDHLKLVNSTRKKAVPDPFRRTELWSDDGKIFTLWLHPGRQKSGVNLNVEIGPILEANESFELIVSGTWRSQSGQSLGKSTTKSFRAGPRINQVVQPQRWRTTAPPSGTRGPLKVLFDRPLDWSLLHSEFFVQTATGVRVAGRIATSPGEREWHFVPTEDWRPGKYSISVGTAVEDLAGNNLRRPFEVDVTAARPETTVGPRVLVPFEVQR